jgi:hypothetical protein
MHGKDQNASFGHHCQDLPRGVQTVQVRHSNIEQEDVWLQSAGKLDGFTTVHGLATNLPTRVAFEHAANASPRHLVVVRDKDSKRAQAPPPRTKDNKSHWRRLFAGANAAYEEYLRSRRGRLLVSANRRLAARAVRNSVFN